MANYLVFPYNTDIKCILIRIGDTNGDNHLKNITTNEIFKSNNPLICRTSKKEK
jgi:hypothetical protein